MYAGVLGFLLAVALLGAVVACGGSDQSSGSAAETAQKSASANGFSTYSVGSQGFSVAVPDSWKTASVDEVLDDASVEQLREKSPALGNALADLGKPSSVIKLLAFDPDAKNGFATNLNVGVTPLPDDVSEEEFFAANIEQVKQASGRSPDQEELDLPAGHALHINWELPGFDPAPVADQYLFYTPGRAYVLTYSALREQTDEYASTFERSVRSFQHD